MRIVLVDDSETFRDRVRRHLTGDPSVVIVGEAADGDTAVRTIDALRPDVVLLDLHLPVSDGFAVLRQVKDQFPLIRVIVLTADSTAGVRQRCANLRADGFIAKSDASLDILPALRRSE